MSRTLLKMLAASSILAAVPLAASAQSINDRQTNLDARIDAGIRNGSLTRGEAARLRAEFSEISRLEAEHRRSGRDLTTAERQDLDRRFDALSRQVRDERSDRQSRGGGSDGNVNARQREMDERIEAGVRDRSLSRAEANQLRAESAAIERIERSYRDSGRGLSQVERHYLDRRFDALERRLRQDRHDDDRRWTRLDARQAQFDTQLDQAVRERRVSAREAQTLRLEFRSIARLERQYRQSRPGITPAERADLNRRFDRMEGNFRAATSPTDNLFDLLFGFAG